MTDKTCKGCIYENRDRDTEDEYCDDCSRWSDACCYCHINPPCDICVKDRYTT